MACAKETCRFCLDSHNAKRNPLIKPCDCRGSIAYVHVRCLQQWQLIDFERNGITCGLCLTEYTNTGNPHMEHIPNDGGYALLFLRYPFLGGIVVHYIWLTHLSLTQTPQFNPRFDPLYVQYQLGFQLLYAITFYRHFLVRHSELYQKEWIQPSTLLLVLLHAMANFGMLTESFVFGIFLNFLLGFYWQRHASILRALNDRFLAE